MSKYKKDQSKSPKAEEDAIKIAHGIQKNGQTKEQTKLIAQGIKKGIDLYKKQQNAKNRDIDKSRKQANKQKNTVTTDVNPLETIQYKQHWLPWVLLTLSWVAMGGYFILGDL